MQKKSSNFLTIALLYNPLNYVRTYLKLISAFIYIRSYKKFQSIRTVVHRFNLIIDKLSIIIFLRFIFKLIKIADDIGHKFAEILVNIKFNKLFTSF